MKKKIYIISVILLIKLACTNSTLQQQTKDGVMCDCMKSIRCKSWLSAVNSGNYLQLPVCGYDKHSLQPLLCCPQKDATGVYKVNRTKREVLQGQKNIQLSCSIISQTLTPAEVAIKKCNEYSKEVLKVFEVSEGDGPYQKQERDTCLKNDDESSEPREFPHFALIGLDRKNEPIKWICGGSLISERYVLTSVVCSKQKLVKWVKLGEFDISTDEDVAKPKIYEIFEKIHHPDYRDLVLYHDIALLKLNKDVEFNTFIRPACLFTKRDSPDDKAFIVGYGKIGNDGNSSEIPKKVEMEIINNKVCDSAFRNTNIKAMLPQKVNPDLMICAKQSSNNFPACHGDGGGPLQIPLKKPYCMYGIIGILSFGTKGCTINSTEVSTRVAYHVPWIVQNVWPDELQ